MVPLDDAISEQLETFKSYGITKPFVSLDDAAKALDVHLNTLRKAVEDNRLTVRRFSANTVRVPVNELAKFALTDYEKPDQEADEETGPLFRLPGRIDFAIHVGPSGKSLAELQMLPSKDPEKTVEVVTDNDQSVEIYSEQYDHWVLSGLSVALRPVVSSKKFSEEADASYEHAVEFLRKSKLRWSTLDAPSYDDEDWLVEELMPDVLEPSLQEGGYTLVPYFERSPQVPKNPGTFDNWNLEKQSFWLYAPGRPKSETSRISSRVGARNSRSTLTFLPPEQWVPKQGIKKNYVWYGAIVLDWRFAGF